MTPLEQFIILADVELGALFIILVIVCRKPRQTYDYGFKDPGYLDHILHQNYQP